MKGHCSKCGQPLPPEGMRGGVFLTPQRRRIFDAVQKHPGLSARELAPLIYPDKPPLVAAKTIASTINQINSQLASTDVRISRAGYRVENGKA